MFNKNYGYLRFKEQFRKNSQMCLSVYLLLMFVCGNQCLWSSWLTFHSPIQIIFETLLITDSIIDHLFFFFSFNSNKKLVLMKNKVWTKTNMWLRIRLRYNFAIHELDVTKMMMKLLSHTSRHLHHHEYHFHMYDYLIMLDMSLMHDYCNKNLPFIEDSMNWGSTSISIQTGSKSKLTSVQYKYKYF
jgi:hypothetical protein